MQKRSILFIVLGLVILAAAFFIGGEKPSAPEDLKAACEKKFENTGSQGDVLISRCKEVTFAIATTATNAQDAAKAISSANQSDFIMNMIQKFLLGFGSVLVFCGTLIAFRKNKTTL